MKTAKEYARSEKQLGNSIRSFRKQQGLKQSELAEKVGIRQATISEIENGQRSYSDIIFKILNALNVQIAIEEISADTELFNPEKFYNE